MGVPDGSLHREERSDEHCKCEAGEARSETKKETKRAGTQAPGTRPGREGRKRLRVKRKTSEDGWIGRRGATPPHAGSGMWTEREAMAAEDKPRGASKQTDGIDFRWASAAAPLMGQAEARGGQLAVCTRLSHIRGRAKA